MKWIDRWFYKKARWCWHRAGIQYPDWKAEQDALDRLYRDRDDTRPQVEVSDSGIYRFENGLGIDIKSVMGGYVVTVRHPAKENKTNYEESRLTSYLVTDEQDFDQELCRILAMERLKQ
jgi:hypothetical protein